MKLLIALAFGGGGMGTGQPFTPRVVSSAIFYVCCDKKKVGKHAVEDLNKPIITVLLG